MTIKERLELLAKNKFIVTHGLMGLMKLDLIRVRKIKKDREVIIDEHSHINSYCEFAYADYVNENEIYQNISEDILNQKLIHEEVWMLGLQCSLDLFIKEI